MEGNDWWKTEVLYCRLSCRVQPIVFRDWDYKFASRNES